MIQWKVTVTGQARKFNKNLSKKALKSFAFLIVELQTLGPYRSDWPYYTKMNGKDDYHCHIEKGNPHYVVCWLLNKKDKSIEVYYAGTHEKAPY